MVMVVPALAVSSLTVPVLACLRFQPPYPRVAILGIIAAFGVVVLSAP